MYTLADFTWLAQSLQTRPTRLQELVAQQPVLYGTTNASGRGMGGVILPPAESQHAPVLWRLPFPAIIQAKLVSTSNPTGLITNSDLELAATIMQHDAICHLYDVRERTIHTSTDNQATQAWQTRASPPPRTRLYTGVSTAPTSHTPTIPSLHSVTFLPPWQIECHG
jgi:hypothetical protein